MPNRPYSHNLEARSHNRLHEVFEQPGWVVEDLRNDYGEDLFVRIFEKGKATPFSFFIQAKATNHIERYMHADRKCISYPIKADHFKHWMHFWEPIILTV
jgi:hypothetical protein